MSRTTTQVLGPTVQGKDSGKDWAKQTAIVISASLFVALCARVTVPLPFTPVPLTLQNFGVLIVGLFLGSRRGFAALVLYLAEGAMGLPGISYPRNSRQRDRSSSRANGWIPHGLSGGGIRCRWIYEQKSESRSSQNAHRFAWAALASATAEIVLFAGGLSWLAVLTHSVSLAIKFGFYWFVFAEVIKVLMASALAARWPGRLALHQ